MICSSRFKGPRFDGHSFVAEVLERGAAGAIVERGCAGLQSKTRPTAVIEVGDTLRALQDMAHAVRAAAATRVIAITGSAGKTTTKETIAEMLATRYRVVKNKGNLNNHIGLPLSCAAACGPDMAVMELGMNHAGEISRLVEIAEPDVRVWTNVGDAHLGFFASPDAIADAKGEILQRATGATLLVCNADDARVMSRERESSRPDDDVRNGGGRDGARGLHRGPRRRRHARAGRRRQPASACSKHRCSDAATWRTCWRPRQWRSTPVSLSIRSSSRPRLRPADRRGAVARLRGGVVLIDDSYNSSPSALRPALDVVAHETRCARKVAVLGEMLELGDHARMALHDECGRAAARAGLTKLLFAIGGAPRARSPTRQWRAACRAARCPATQSTEAVRRHCRHRSRRRPRAGQGLARHAHRRGGGSACGGVRLMLFYLLPQLAGMAPFLGALNVTRYITFRTAAASLTAFAISMLLGPWLIRTLRDFQIGQIIRQEGPQSHRAKAGTPTMGGLLILTAAVVPTLLWADLSNPYIWIAVLATVGFGAVGFLDDYLKITRRSHHGLMPRYKMLGQILVALGVGVAVLLLSQQNPPLYNTRLIFPFFKNLIPDLGWFYVVFAVFVLVFASNGVNLTDGLDGLAISTFAVAAAAFTALAYVTGHAVLANYLLLVRFPDERADDLLRCARRRQSRLPLVQPLSRRDLHGRRRLAGAGRRARHGGDPHQAGAAAADRRRRLRARRRCR